MSTSNNPTHPSQTTHTTPARAPSAQAFIPGAEEPTQPELTVVFNPAQKADRKGLRRKAQRGEDQQIEQLTENSVIEDGGQAVPVGLETTRNGMLELAQADTSRAVSTGMAVPGEQGAMSNAATAGAKDAMLTSGLLWGGIVLGGLSAGTNGGGSASSTTSASTPQVSTLVSGTITAGPVIAGHGLSVKVFDLNGNEIGAAAVDADGRFSVNIGSYTGGVVAKVVDANNGLDFRDEATANKDLNATLMAIDVVSTAGGNVTLHINPATAVAAAKAGLDASNGSGVVGGASSADKIATIQAANASVAAAIGLPGSLTGTAVVATVKADGSDNTANANKLGFFLAAMSGIDKSNAGNMVVAINSLASGIVGSGSSATMSAATESTLITGATNANLSAATYTASLAPTAAAAAAAMGATLDAGEVAALTPAVAANLTPTQLQSIADVSVIPVAALRAMAPATLAAGLDAGKVAALSSAQLAALTASQVGSLSNAQLAALTSDQAAAIATAGGFASLTPAQVAQLGASAIDSVPDSVIAQLSAAQVAALSCAQLAALTASQVGSLGNAQLAALTSDQAVAIATAGGFASLTPAQVAQLGASAIDSVPDSVIAQLSAAQVAALSCAQLAALTSDQAAAIATAGGFASLTPAQVAQLGASAIDSVPDSVIAQLSAAQVAAMSSAQLDALTASQVGSLGNDRVQALAPALTAGVAAKLTATQLQSVADVSVIPPAALGAVSGEALASLAVDQLGNLGTAQLQALSAAQVVALANAGKLAALADIAALGDKVASLGTNALGSLDAGQLAGLSQAQISAIAAAGKLSALTDMASLGTDITALSAAQIATLSDVQLAALSAAQITALGNAGHLGALAVNLLANPVVNQIAALGDDIAGLSASALAAFTPAQLEGLSATQIGLLASATPSALTNLTDTQIAQLGTDITGLSAAQVKALGATLLAGISSAQADALATTGDLADLTATEIMQLSGAAIYAVPTLSITQLSAQQLNSLGDTQLLGLTRAQITALANANRLTALTAGKIAAIGNDIDGLSAAQTAALSNDQLAGLSKTQVAALAAVGDLAMLTGDKLRALGADISGVSAAQAAALSNTQLADLDAMQLAALAADGDLASLSPAQITALGTDITGLTPAQLRALSAPALALVPAGLVAKLGAEVANLTLAQAQALTAGQLNALNTAGLLDDITQPLSSTQVSGAGPAGLGLSAVDNAAKLALFNSALQAASGSAALNLAALATGAAAVVDAVNGVNGDNLTVANLQALGLADVSSGILEAIRSKIDATSSGSDASLVDSINELRAIVANASGKLADGYVNAAEAAGGVNVAVALPAGAQPGQTITLTLPGSGGAPDQTTTRTVDQPSLDAGFALVTLSAAQLAAAGEGSKAITASINGGSPFAVEGFVLDTVAPALGLLTPKDGSSILANANLVLAFDAPISKGSGNIRLVNDTTGATTTIAVGSNEVSISGSTLTINPASDLTPGHDYHIEIDSGAITDLAGNAWAGIADATTSNLVASVLSSTLNAIATDGTVNAAEGAAPVTISGTVSALGSSAAAIAELQQGDFTITLVPRGGGSTVSATLDSYDTGTGAWSSTVAANTLVDGKTYDVTVSINGSSGAAQGQSATEFSVVSVDLIAPDAPAIASVTDDVGSIQGTVAAGGDSDDTAPVVRVSLAGSNAVAGDSVRLYDGTGAGAPTLGSAQTLTALNIANGHVDVALSGLSQGTYTLAARVTDAWGNTGAASAGWTLTIDTVAPTQTVSSVSLSDDTTAPHGSTSDRNTSTAQQTITATLSGALADGDTLFGSVDGGSNWTNITSKASSTTITWDGATLLQGSNNLAFRVMDRAGYFGPTSTAAYVLDTAAPAFSSATTTSVAENATAAYDAQTTEGDTGMHYALSGTDAALFNINATTGAVTFKAAPDFEAPTDAGANNVYNFTVRATDLAGYFTDRAVALTVTDVKPTSAQLFALWQSDGAGGSGTATTTGALQALTTEITNQRDLTNAAGTANGTNAMDQYINRVTGTDVVSDAEFDAGFTITGKAAAGARDTIRFYLDNNRTNGTDEIGTILTNNSQGVSWTYNNTTGDYTITFAANSAALLQATHNTYGSGVHRLTVDTSGNGTLDAGEASRLFLVASGTAQTSDTGLVGQNYSVQDRPSGNVFVYYYGDPDGSNGFGLWTFLDNGDATTNTSVNSSDRDSQTELTGDFDYYNATGVASGTKTTTANTALGFTTDIAAEVWEFQMGSISATTMNWSAANTFAGAHSARNSNTSRLASLGEMLALYAANFGANSGSGNTVGAVQPMTDITSTNGGVPAEDNRPSGWVGSLFWTAAPTPSGHARVGLNSGFMIDTPDTLNASVSAVL